MDISVCVCVQACHLYIPLYLLEAGMQKEQWAHATHAHMTHVVALGGTQWQHEACMTSLCQLSRTVTFSTHTKAPHKDCKIHDKCIVIYQHAQYLYCKNETREVVRFTKSSCYVPGILAFTCPISILYQAITNSM